MDLLEYNTAIESHLAGWNPTQIVGDNLPAKTADQTEFIRLTVLDGVGIFDETVGARVSDVRGGTTDNVLILQFDVFAEMNSGRIRALELCQAIADHWQVRNLGNGLYLDVASPIRIGEVKPHYRMRVDIPGRREEFINLNR